MVRERLQSELITERAEAEAEVGEQRGQDREREPDDGLDVPFDPGDEQRPPALDGVCARLVVALAGTGIPFEEAGIKGYEHHPRRHQAG